MTLTLPRIIMPILLLALGWLAVMSLPRTEVEPEAVLERDFSLAKSSIAAALREHMAEELAALKAPPLYIGVDVAATPREDGDYDIEINWFVYDAERSLGTVRQRNVFPGWYVNRGWHGDDNPTWSQAAHSAAKGVVGLTKPKSEAEK